VAEVMKGAQLTVGGFYGHVDHGGGLGQHKGPAHGSAMRRPACQPRQK
jgi:hypothetical protein